MFSLARLVTCFLTLCSDAALISPAIMLGGVTEPLPLATAEPDPPNARAMMLVITRTAIRIFGSFLNDCNPMACHCTRCEPEAGKQDLYLGSPTAHTPLRGSIRALADVDIERCGRSDRVGPSPLRRRHEALAALSDPQARPE